MRAAPIALLTLVSCVALAPASATAQSTCLTRTPAGSVAVARARGGMRISAHAPFEARIEGARVELRLTDLGLRATAQVGDVDLRLRATVEVSPGVFALRGTSVSARSVGARSAIVHLHAVDIEVPAARVPRDALALAGAVGAPGCTLSDVMPAGWETLEAERAQGERVLLRGAEALRVRPGGDPVAARVTSAAAVRLEDRGVWSRIAVGEASLRVVGWVRSDRLDAASSPSLGGGGGSGEGMIGLGCLRAEPGLRAATLDTDTPFLATPAGRQLAELPAGTTLVLGARRGAHVAVIEALGVHRIPRACERGEPTGLGWIAIDALASE